MRWPASILLLITFLTLGTGGLEYLHNLEHLRQDAQRADHHDRSVPQHDESNCFIHAQLHVPTIAIAWVPLLVSLGLFVAFLTEIAQPLFSQRACFSIDCRGPPAC